MIRHRDFVCHGRNDFTPASPLFLKCFGPFAECIDNTLLNHTEQQGKNRFRLRSELVEHFCVRLHEPDQIFRLEYSERSHVRSGLGEAIQLV